MPSFYDSVAEADRWALTDYIYSLGDGDKASYATLLVASPLDEELDLSRGASLFEGAPPSRFPIVGQIMEPGRQLSPPVTTVVVRAVFDQRQHDNLRQMVLDGIEAATLAHREPRILVQQFSGGIVRAPCRPRGMRRPARIVQLCLWRAGHLNASENSGPRAPAAASSPAGPAWSSQRGSRAASRYAPGTSAYPAPAGPHRLGECAMRPSRP